MKVVLLGPHGQLGSDVRQVVDERSNPYVRLICIGREQLDVTDRGMLERTLGDLDFDALINCTSYHRTDEVEDNATLGFRVNAQAVEDLARLCAQRRARLVQISTDYVFGGDLGRTHALTELDPIAPVNVYGASKAMGETLARLLNPDTLIVRVASLFGVAGASGKGGNFIETIVRLARERGKLRVVHDQTMSPTSTYDAASMILDLLAMRAPAGTYHCVNEGSASWWLLARTAVEMAGIEAEVEPITSQEYRVRAMRPCFSVLDSTKTRGHVGMVRHWRESLAEYLEHRGYRQKRRPARGRRYGVSALAAVGG